uniref:Uncharacterized protein n=1 Tax=viral metagenome TaxID=1070528 RepID=A0A6C0ADW5_9ZZZZ
MKSKGLQLCPKCRLKKTHFFFNNQLNSYINF